MAVIEFELFTVNDDQRTAPNCTVETAMKFAPVIATTVPPAKGPALGLTLVIVGAAGLVKVNWSADEVAEVFTGFVTVRSTTPGASAGEVAVICVGLSTVNNTATEEPNCPAVTPVRLLPATTTAVPPVMMPEAGATLVTTGFA